MLELNIESKDFDFLGMAGEIEAWCNKNQIAPKLANRMQLVFEEAMQLLVTLLENPRVQAVCEYSEATEAAVWTIRYAGPRCDMSQMEDDLSLAVLKGIAERTEYIWSQNNPMGNQLTIQVTRA